MKVGAETVQVSITVVDSKGDLLFDKKSKVHIYQTIQGDWEAGFIGQEYNTSSDDKLGAAVNAMLPFDN